MNPHVMRRVIGGLLAVMIAPLAGAEVYLARDLDNFPKAKFQAAPTYPYEQRANGIMGVAVVRSVINAAGDVESCEVVGQSEVAFGKAAYEAVLRWKYAPAKKQGAAVKFTFQVPVAFTLMGEDFRNPESQIFGFPPGSPAKVPAEYRYDKPPFPVDTPGPVYPYEMWMEKISGKATVAYAVDESGRVIDVQLMEASSPEFGFALMAAIQSWHFEPAALHGKPVRAYARVSSSFDLYQPPGASDARLRDLIKKGQKLGNPRDLDAALTPEFQVSPKYPFALAGEGHAGEAVIEFIIDRDGCVRLPRIISATKPEFGWSAATAVRQWRFIPPRKAGQPVDVRVRAPFGFSALAP